MADVVIALPRRSQDVKLLEQYGHLLKRSGDTIDKYSQLIAPDHLAIMRHAIEESLRPASLIDVAKAVAVISVSFKIPGPDVLKDPGAFSSLMINDLHGYSTDVLDEAIRQLRREPKIRFVPAIGEIVGVCEKIVGERRLWVRTIDLMMEEHHRRRKEAERETERETEREHARRRREEQAARIRALYGDAVAVSAEEIELATYLRPIMHWPIGKMFPWHESLDRGELWAATHCRRLALAERARRAELKGLIPPGHAAAIARLAIVDEPTARRKLADEIGEDPFAEQVVDLAPCFAQEGTDFNAAVMKLEAAAWEERGIFEGDLTLPDPLVQNERFGPVPAATLNFKEDPQQTAAALKRAKEVLELQR